MAAIRISLSLACPIISPLRLDRVSMQVTFKHLVPHKVLSRLCSDNKLAIECISGPDVGIATVLALSLKTRFVSRPMGLSAILLIALVGALSVSPCCYVYHYRH